MSYNPIKLASIALFTLMVLPLGAWSPGTGNESATTGFIVDTQSRNDVISFWHCVYMESEGFENSAPSSQAFQDDVQRRINYFRAMANMSASIDLTSTSTIVTDGGTPANAQPSASTTKQATAQGAAQMMAANSSQFIAGGGVATGAHDPHNPPLSWVSDNNIARNGAFNSILAIGLYGPAAIDAYISENDNGPAGAENNDVGHRRLLFQSRLQEVATGDIEPNGGNFSANAVYIRGNLLPSNTPSQFVPWPNVGFIPEAITPVRWSLSFRDANFTGASVTVTGSNDVNVPVTIQSTSAVFGDETIIWDFNSAIPSAATEDQTFNITVSNIIINGTPTNYSYQVTIINPDRLLESTDLTGSINPPDSGANYFFNPVDQAEEYELDISSLLPATWFEGAEDGTDALIIDLTDPTYNLRSSVNNNLVFNSQFWDTGSRAFRLAFPRNEFNAFQEFRINRTLIPRSGAELTFRFRRGFMAGNTQLSVQSSTDGGVTWGELAAFLGTNQTDNFFSSQSVSIPSIDQNTLIRFVLHQPANTGVFSLDDPNFSPFPLGAFIDGIEPVNCDVLESLSTTSYGPSAISAPLNASTGGGPLIVGDSYILRLRVRVGCSWFPFGNSLEVFPVSAASLSAYELWFRGDFPIIGAFEDDYDQDGIANGIERVFGLSPINSSDGTSALIPQISGNNLQLSHPIIPGETISAEYSSTLLPGSWSPATVTILNGVATASTPIDNSSTLFIRWFLTP